MNTPPPENFNYLTKKLYKAYEAVAIQSTTRAAFQIRKTLRVIHNETVNCQVSVDGAWQKRGHQSRNGIVTIISKGMESAEMPLVFQKNAEVVFTGKLKPFSLDIFIGS